MELLILDFSSIQHNNFQKLLIISKIMGEAGGKYVISAMQDDSTITYFQHSKVYIQKVTTQYNGIRDWYNKTLLYEYNIFNY